MIFSPQQEIALAQIRDWIANQSHDPAHQVRRFGGFAGTGKTTLAKYALAGAPGKVIFMAPTGKAAHVLAQKGCEGAQTIHSAIYIPKGEKLSERVEAARREIKQLDERAVEPDLHPGELEAIDERRRDLRKLLKIAKSEARPMFSLDPAAELGEPHVWGCAVDEASMMGTRIASDLASFGKPILALGDPAQLTPVQDRSWFNDADPDVMLTEIHRQAAESGILRLSMYVRNGDVIQFGAHGDDCLVYRRGDLAPDKLRDLVVNADQILVGRNATRKAYNQRMRQLRGTDSKGPFPAEGDRVVCLRNDSDAGVLNGSVWIVKWAETDEIAMRTTMELESADGTGETVATTCHAHFFVGREEEIPFYELKDAHQFDYGYALTVHKSQGSQWDRVVVFDESAQFQSEWRQHLYTAVTRAAKHLVVVRP